MKRRRVAHGPETVPPRGPRRRGGSVVRVSLADFLRALPAAANPSPRRARWGAEEGEFLGDPMGAPLATPSARVEEALRSGLRMFRGRKARRHPTLGFSTDPGNYGRGVYWTTDPDVAWFYADYDEAAVEAGVVRLASPLVLDAASAAALREGRGTVRAPGDDRDRFEERLAAADALTRELLAAGRDGVAVLHRSSLEVVVFRP